MTDQEERDAIIAAGERLFAGRPLRSSGNLDIICLAEEAGLKRNKLTHKHIDVKGYAQESSGRWRQGGRADTELVERPPYLCLGKITNLERGHPFRIRSQRSHCRV